MAPNIRSPVSEGKTEQETTTAIIDLMDQGKRHLPWMLLLILLASACSIKHGAPNEYPDELTSIALTDEIADETEFNPIPTKTPQPVLTQNPIISPEANPTSFREADRMSLVEIPAGKVWIGCDENNNAGFSCWGDELPLHQVSVDAFVIDKFEVTNAQYTLCVTNGACAVPYYQRSATRPDYYSNEEYANYPKVAVSWFEASDYCEWAGGRLPTEAEWVRAARGGDKRVYPWGDETPDCLKANTLDENNGKLCLGDTAPVGSYPEGASPFGVMDMVGNAWEWTADWYHKDYYSISPELNPQGPEQGVNKVVHGGGFDYGWKLSRIAYTTDHDPAEHKIGFGFRCVMDGKGN